MRGEHLVSSHDGKPHNGSSPHARGTRTSSPVCSARVTVHPRMRGEHPKPAIIGRNSAGSSPHARGTRRQERLQLRGRRFIPACAGNTTPGPPRPTAPPVHPRMRGEHAGIHLKVRDTAGSSPHARGTQAAKQVGNPAPRFIPACAGNTPTHPTRTPTHAVHSRMRGEHPFHQV